MKTSTLFAALSAAAMTLCTAAAAAQAVQSAPQAATPAPGTPWSLDDCIGYALHNNVGVQQQALQVEQTDVKLSTSKYSRLPDLSASVGYNATFGRGTSDDNIRKTGTIQSGSFDVGASMPLFDGFRINREIKGGKLDLAAAMQDLERAREDLSINVMTLYLQVLYNKELTQIAERQLELSTQQAVRSRELVAAGKQPESARYESEALQANDELNLTQARNDLRLALLNLSQALNRESAAGFDIVAPQFDSVALASLHMLGTADDVYAYATENRPHIKAERLRLESAENAVRIAKSALYPSLSLRGGYGTGIYSTQERVRRRVDERSDLQPPRHAQQHPLGPDSHAQTTAGRDRRRAIAAQGDRAGVVQRRRRLREIPFGGRRPHLGTGGLRLRTAEGRRRPFDGLRLQRRQNTYGKGRVGTRAGEIRIRIPVENPRLLPRPAARTMTNSRKQARTE